MKPTTLLLAVLCLSGCSHRAVYENLQINQRQECARGPASQYEACLERTRKSYDEYERERRRALDEPEPPRPRAPA